MNSNKVILDLRGVRISIDRDALMELPESVLLCLFPNGVVLSPQRQPRMEGDIEEEGEDVYYVEFDAQCLEFVLNFFSQARDDFYGPPEGPRRDLSESFPPSPATLQNPLFLKQAIIVLREELEYFSIPPKVPGDAISDGKINPNLMLEEEAMTDVNGAPNKALVKLKMDCGNALLARTSIFTALQRNVNRENNVAEQHLIDMLCMSGFEREDTWGYRSLEPNRCCIASIALVLLKTGIVHPPLSLPANTDSTPSAITTDVAVAALPARVGATGEKPTAQVNAQQLATAQKLLLFWRKPARKCWWDATDLIVNEGLAAQKEVKVWSRRVWTLETSLI